MHAHALNETDREQLSAWLDGELSEAEARQVAQRVEQDPAWATEADALRRLDGLLDAWTAPPLRRDLSDAVLARAHQRPPRHRWLATLTPLAAAAAIALAVGIFHLARPAGPTQGPPLAGQAQPADAIQQVVSQIPPGDRLTVENLDLLEDYAVLTDFATLEALERLERHQGT